MKKRSRSLKVHAHTNSTYEHVPCWTQNIGIYVYICVHSIHHLTKAIVLLDGCLWGGGVYAYMFACLRVRRERLRALACCIHMSQVCRHVPSGSCSHAAALILCKCARCVYADVLYARVHAPSGSRSPPGTLILDLTLPLPLPLPVALTFRIA